jgi:hypothetical protein
MSAFDPKRTPVVAGHLSQGRGSYRSTYLSKNKSLLSPAGRNPVKGIKKIKRKSAPGLGGPGEGGKPELNCRRTVRRVAHRISEVEDFMKRLLLMSTAVALFAAAPAQADIIQFVNPNPAADCGASPTANCASIVEFGALGFGNFPRVLTLQDNGQQAGSIGVDAQGNQTATGGAVTNGNNKSEAPTFGSLGYDRGDLLAVGYNSNQSGNGGITLNDLVFNIFDNTNALVRSYDLAAALHGDLFSQADLAVQQGNGNGLFIFKLDTAQQGNLTSLLGTYTASQIAAFHLGLAADFGCAMGAPATCAPSNDGPDSFLAIAAGNPIINPTCTGNLCAVPAPIAGAGFPSMLAGFGMLWALARRRRKKFSD